MIYKTAGRIFILGLMYLKGYLFLKEFSIVLILQLVSMSFLMPHKRSMGHVCIYGRPTRMDLVSLQCILLNLVCIAPMRPISTSRLELSGAQLLVEFIHYVVFELTKNDTIIDSSNITYWTDSTIVLSWKTPLNH